MKRKMSTEKPGQQSRNEENGSDLPRYLLKHKIKSQLFYELNVLKLYSCTFIKLEMFLLLPWTTIAITRNRTGAPD